MTILSKLVILVFEIFKILHIINFATYPEDLIAGTTLRGTPIYRLTWCVKSFNVLLCWERVGRFGPESRWAWMPVSLRSVTHTGKHLRMGLSKDTVQIQ